MHVGSARYAFESRVDPPQAVSKDMLDEAPLGMAEPALPSPEGDALPQSLTQWQLGIQRCRAHAAVTGGFGEFLCLPPGFVLLGAFC